MDPRVKPEFLKYVGETKIEVLKDILNTEFQLNNKSLSSKDDVIKSRGYLINLKEQCELYLNEVLSKYDYRGNPLNNERNTYTNFVNYLDSLTNDKESATIPDNKEHITVTLKGFKLNKEYHKKANILTVIYQLFDDLASRNYIAKNYDKKTVKRLFSIVNTTKDEAINKIVWLENISLLTYLIRRLSDKESALMPEKGNGKKWVITSAFFSTISDDGKIIQLTNRQLSDNDYEANGQDALNKTLSSFFEQLKSI